MWEAGREVPRPGLLLILRVLVAFSDSVVQFIQITKHTFLELSCEGRAVGMDDPGQWLCQEIPSLLLHKCQGFRRGRTAD